MSRSSSSLSQNPQSLEDPNEHSLSAAGEDESEENLEEQSSESEESESEEESELDSPPSHNSSDFSDSDDDSDSSQVDEEDRVLQQGEGGEENPVASRIVVEENRVPESPDEVAMASNVIEGLLSRLLGHEDPSLQNLRERNRQIRYNDLKNFFTRRHEGYIQEGARGSAANVANFYLQLESNALHLTEEHFLNIPLQRIFDLLCFNLTVKTLKISGNITAWQLRFIADTFKINDTIINLDLSQAKIADGGEFFKDSLASIFENKSLINLNLSDCKINDKIVELLVMKNNSIQILDLSNNRITNASARYLALGIPTEFEIICHRQLQNLNLSNTAINDKGAEDFTKNQNLTSVTFPENISERVKLLVQLQLTNNKNRPQEKYEEQRRVSKDEASVPSNASAATSADAVPGAPMKRDHTVTSIEGYQALRFQGSYDSRRGSENEENER